MKTLVAGIGNIFLGDDGFGVEVVRRLDRTSLPPGVHLEDFGIRGMHLAHELLLGYDAVVLIDCLPPADDDSPGTISVLEIEADEPGESTDRDLTDDLLADAHSFQPHVALMMVRRLGGRIGSRIYLVGCAPQDTSEGIGLSEPVEASVERGATAVMELLDQLYSQSDLTGERLAKS